MKTAALLAFVSIASVAGCASAPPPKPVETTSAVVHSREAFTPPDQWEMQIADKPAAEVDKNAPAGRVTPESTAAKRQAGSIVTLPGKPTPKQKQEKK
jgi:hypothetical protein